MNLVENLELNTTSLHERELTVTIPQNVVGQEFEKALNKVQRSARHKGFRPGKMPKAMILSFYGKAVKDELVEKLTKETFDFACKEKDVVPVSSPKLEPLSPIEQDKSFTYRAIFQVKPKIDTPLYKGLDLEFKKFVFTDADIEGEIADLRESMATFTEPLNRTEISECDLVQCESVVKVDGVAHPEYSHKDYSVPLFAPNLPADLKSALLGKKVSDVVSVNYTMPEDHQDSSLAGKICEMELTIHSFKERVLPKLDDDFAKDLSDKFTSLEDLKESVKLRFTITASRRDDYFKQDAITKALVEKNPLEVPEALVERMALSLINRELEAMGKKAADELVKNHWQELWQSVQSRSLFRVKAELLIEALVKDLPVKVSDEEVAMKMKKLKDVTREDASYALSVEKLLALIEQEAQVVVVEEPLFKESN